MAFTWEVEALRKLVEGIIADTASEYNKEAEEWGALRKPEWADVIGDLEFGDEFHYGGHPGVDADEVKERWGFAEDYISKRKSPAKRLAYIDEKAKKVRDEFDFKPGEKLPRYEIDIWGNVTDRAARDELERRRHAEDLDQWRDHADNMYEFHPHNIDPDAWGSHIPSEEWYDEKAYRVSAKDQKKDKLKLDWVNEILKEFPEDKAPEVLRLPHLKDEERPDITPFLSYLLRQSPYARLPAAGLLGLGLMGYSKPAY